MKTMEFPYEIKSRQLDSDQMIRDMTMYPTKETSSHVLIMRNINWPSQCPCCLSEETSSYHALKCDVNWKVDGNTRYFFPLEWLVPYCSTCLDHVKMRLKITIGAWVIWVVMLALGGAFFSEYFVAQGPYNFVQLAPILGILGVSAIICLWLLPRMLTQVLVIARTTPTCVADDNYAVSAPPTPPGSGKVQIYFESDEYADAFTALNSV